MKAWSSSKNDFGLFVKNQTQRQVYVKQKLSRNIS